MCLSAGRCFVFEIGVVLGSNGMSNRPRNTLTYNIKGFVQSVGPRCGSRIVFVLCT